ncbi:MAG: ferredoxin family protein [Chloroflexota bacterium]|nr:ferredoxin family protein [Chloroflexota bacterium]
MSTISIEDKLSVNKFDIDKDVHIKINEDICKSCQEHVCLYVCPANCYKLSEGHITFSYEGCLECGSCHIACDKGAIDWTLPRPGFGICYQYG